MRSRILFAAVVLSAAGAAVAQLRPGGLRRNGNTRSGASAVEETQPQMSRDDLKNVRRGTNGVPVLAFNQAPIDLVLEAYAAEVGKTIIPAPDLPKSTITLRSLEDQANDPANTNKPEKVSFAIPFRKEE